MREKILRKSGFSLGLKMERFLPLETAKTLIWLILLTAVVFLVLAVWQFSYQLLGVSLLFFCLLIILVTYVLFLSFLKKEKNITVEEVKNVLENKNFGLLIDYKISEALFYTADNNRLYQKRFFEFLLKKKSFIWILERLNIPKDDFLKSITEKYKEEEHIMISSLLSSAVKNALAGNHLKVGLTDFLHVLYQQDEKFQKIMFHYDVDEDLLREVVYWRNRYEEDLKKSYLDKIDPFTVRGIGKGWGGGYTINLDKIAHDLTREPIVNSLPKHLYSKPSSVELLEKMLVRGSGNALLVGAPGSGRHTVLKAFAKEIRYGTSFARLKYQRVLLLDASSVVSGVQSLNGVVARIQTFFGEALRAGNIILAINNIDAWFTSDQEAGKVNATEAMLPFLKSKLKVIGITTRKGYKTTIEKNPELKSLFAKLQVEEASKLETLLILQDSALEIERQSKLFFTQSALKELVELTDKLILDLPNPEKSLNLLEEVAVFAGSRGIDKVLVKHVRRVVSTKLKIPVESVVGKEKQVLMNLENILHTRIVGQNQAIREVSDALRRARAGVRSEKKPIGTFLFLGPTGVGKTETAKVLATSYFGSEDRIIRLDMSEFQEVHTINNLIGDADTDRGGILTDAVIENPFSLILLDELEKAHPQVLDIFLSILDEGKIQDAFGRTINFTNTMIIATSNAGAEHIRELVKAEKDLSEMKEELLDYLMEKNIYRPEFLNRFDSVVVFHPLDDEQMTQIAVMLLKDLNERLDEEDIAVNVTPELAQSIAKKGGSREFGARPLRRYIQENVESYIAKGLISGDIERGSLINIDPNKLQD